MNHVWTLVVENNIITVYCTLKITLRKSERVLHYYSLMDVRIKAWKTLHARRFLDWKYTCTLIRNCVEKSKNTNITPNDFKNIFIDKLADIIVYIGFILLQTISIFTRILSLNPSSQKTNIFHLFCGLKIYEHKINILYHFCK